MLDFFDVEVDHENKTVTTSFYGLVSQPAVFREGICASLTHAVQIDDLSAEKRPAPASAPNCRADNLGFLGGSDGKKGVSLPCSDKLDREQKGRQSEKDFSFFGLCFTHDGMAVQSPSAGLE